jgi:hypothetical protein
MKQYWDNFLLWVMAAIGFFFLWFVVAVIGNAFGINLGLSTWRSLWTPVINPLLGIFFLGVAVSLVSSKLKQIMGS